MKIINYTDKKIDIMIGHEKADEPDYWFILEEYGKTMDGDRVDLEEKGVDLSDHDLLVIKEIKGDKSTIDDKSNKMCNDGTEETGSHWTVSPNEKEIIALDFDHTITTKCMACYNKLKGDDIQEGAKEGIELLRKYFKVWIYSGVHPDYEPRDIEGYLKMHNIDVDKILRTKPPAMFIIDDRAIHHTSWKNTMLQIDKRLLYGLPKECNENCWRFRRGKCETDNKNGICDKPKMYTIEVK